MTERVEPFLQPKICESCGSEFDCGASSQGCWCTEIDLFHAAAEKIKSKFGDCLCRSCLEKLAAPAMLIRYGDGSTDLIAGAVRVDTQNFHEGMFDFYDARGNLLRQIDMGSGITWENVTKSENKIE